eukprot:gene30103-35071_t
MGLLEQARHYSTSHYTCMEQARPQLIFSPMGLLEQARHETQNLHGASKAAAYNPSYRPLQESKASPHEAQNRHGASKAFSPPSYSPRTAAANASLQLVLPARQRVCTAASSNHSPGTAAAISSAKV